MFCKTPAILNAKLIDQLFTDAEVINFCEGLDIVVNNNTIAVLSDYSMLTKVRAIKHKLKLKFSAINIHHSLDQSNHDEKIFTTVCETFPTKETKNIVICFNSSSDKQFIDIYNDIISKKTLSK